MSSFSKKIIAITLLAVLGGFSIFPVFAQSAAAEEPPFECWPKKDCKDNWYRGTITQKSCGPYEKKFGELGFCYTSPPKIDLQIAIGGKSTVAGLSNYIPYIYNYLLGIVSIIAIIMIMYGGIKYLTAGTSGRVTSAKETILGAVVGLFLAFGSYLLLQTINPALTQLKMPDIKMIRTSLLAGNCKTDSGTVLVGQKCNNTCDCKQGKCVPIESGPLEQMVKGVGYGTAATVSLWTLGGGSVAGGAKSILIMLKKGSQAALSVAKTLAPFAVSTAVSHPVATAIIGYSLFNIPSGDTGQPGICMVEANRNVPPGGWCEKNEHCTSGVCVVMPGVGTGLGTIAGGKGIGVCASGEVGSACECAESGVCKGTGGCIAGLQCVDNSNGQYTKSCTDGKAESPCYSNNDCRVSGYTCQETAANTKICTPAGSIGIKTACNSDTVCKSAGYLWLCIKGFCSDASRDGANCCVAGACTSGTSQDCRDGYQCAFYDSTDKGWALMATDENTYKGYKAFSDWQNAYAETTGTLTQCKQNLITAE